MLHPNFLAHVADKAVALWEKLNIFAARDMARRIADAENHMTASADWQKYKMEQAGQSAEEIRKEIRKTLPLSEKQIKEIFSGWKEWIRAKLPKKKQEPPVTEEEQTEKSVDTEGSGTTSMEEA